MTDDTVMEVAMRCAELRIPISACQSYETFDKRAWVMVTDRRGKSSRTVICHLSCTMKEALKHTKECCYK